MPRRWPISAPEFHPQPSQSAADQSRLGALEEQGRDAQRRVSQLEEDIQALGRKVKGAQAPFPAPTRSTAGDTAVPLAPQADPLLRLEALMSDLAARLASAEEELQRLRSRLKRRTHRKGWWQRLLG